MKFRPAFTLFELILAIALSATLLALIGTAVNLYLVRMDSGRTRVEEAQLARSVLSTIAADVRAATVYQTQDISTVEQLAAAAAPIDPDAIDSAEGFGASALGATGAAGGTGQGGSSTMPGGSGETSSGSQGSQSSATTTPPGVNGLVNELQLDVSRLPRLDELFPAVQQQGSSTLASATAVANGPRPSDWKSVRYFVRQGTTVEPSASPTAALSAEGQQNVGGLVRQTLDRATRELAEQAADAQLLNSGQVLLAPEVSQIQFVYFDGTAAVDHWDMKERGSLPAAIEARVWIAPDAADAAESEVPLEPQMYSQTIELPLAQAAASASGSQQSTSGEESTAGEAPSGETGTGFGSGSNEF
jgi:hypothetical protein